MKAHAPQHFLTLSDLSFSDLTNLLKRARELKNLKTQKKLPKPCQDKTQVLVFEKSSTRTRVSFEVAFSLLGGQNIYLNQQISQLGRGESYADTARVLSRYSDLLVMRTFSHKSALEFSHHALVPVVNALTDLCHPCQILADLMTIQENNLVLDSKLKLVYLGDSNNISYSLIQASLIFGFQLVLSGPKDFLLTEHKSSDVIRSENNPEITVQDADILYTDTWISMGQDASQTNLKEFFPYQLNQNLLKKAKPKALVMHNLPAHRGEEITHEVLESAQSLVFDQAENKLYVQMALIEKLMS